MTEARTEEDDQPIRNLLEGIRYFVEVLSILNVGANFLLLQISVTQKLSSYLYN